MDSAKLKALTETAATKQSIFWYMAWGAILLLLAASWKGADMRPLELIRDSGNMSSYAADFFPPNFGQWRMYVNEMMVTLQINEMVFAMLFVVAVGLGPFAGVLALWVHTSGTLAKLFSEAVEAIDPQPVEGIRSTGASALQEIVYGVIPQVIPLWTSYTLYRFEANVRSATVVGMVGAGGIGVVLWEIIRGFQYAETAAVMLIIIATVSVIDLISARVRKFFV
jgi:phosphonate transport system permease protein